MCLMAFYFLGALSFVLSWIIPSLMYSSTLLYSHGSFHLSLCIFPSFINESKKLLPLFNDFLMPPFFHSFHSSWFLANTFLHCKTIMEASAKGGGGGGGEEEECELDWGCEQKPESIYKLARRIKRSENSLYNALRSIFEDSLFVEEMRALWPELPLLANLRCGLWYSTHFDGVCYFKSTDGHTGNWSFSSTRLNLHVASLAAERGGCMIVDATRKGKRFPDSMSKTIPIWACVVNRTIADLKVSSQCDKAHIAESVERRDGLCHCEFWDSALHLPVWVSKTEKENIECRIDDWVQRLKTSGADLTLLMQTLKKPLQPLWISQQSLIWLNEVPDASSWPFTPVILVSASHPTSSQTRVATGGSSWTYIPGAADDEESWARGLTPALFWKHAYDIMRVDPEECKRKVWEIIEKDRVSKAARGLDAPQIRVRSKTGNPNLEGTRENAHIHLATVHTSGSAVPSVELELLQNQVSKVDSRLMQFVPSPTTSDGIHWISTTGLAIGSAKSGKTSYVRLANLFQPVAHIREIE